MSARTRSPGQQATLLRARERALAAAHGALGGGCIIRAIYLDLTPELMAALNGAFEVAFSEGHRAGRREALTEGPRHH